jgi:hypothetical protein
MIRKLGIPLLLGAASLAACESPSDGGAGSSRVRLEVDSVVSASRAVTWKAQAVDGRDNGVAGKMVRFSFLYPASPGASPATGISADSALTDAQGYAQVQFTAPNYGVLNVKAGIQENAELSTDSATVRVRETVTITTLHAPIVELDSLSLEGPQCSSSTYIRSNATTYTVADTAIAAITSTGFGGMNGQFGRAIVARLPGTTRIIATGSAGGADTLRVKVSAPAQPGQLLRRMPVNRPVIAGISPDSVVIARGDTAALTLATDPFSCDAALLPANFVVAIQSSNPAVVQVEASESKRWTPLETARLSSVGVNARLRGVAAGRTEVVATAPYNAPRRIVVIVQ